MVEDLHSISSTIEELLGDGARVHPTFEPAQFLLRLRLDFSSVECQDCILPTDVLQEVITNLVYENSPDPRFVVIIDDPRHQS